MTTAGKLLRVDLNRLSYQVEDIPQHKGRMELACCSKEGHTLSTALKVVSDRYTDADNTKANKLDSFAIINVAGTAKLSECASAFVRIDNLTNKKYRMFQGQVQPGRTFMVGMSLSF